MNKPDTLEEFLMQSYDGLGFVWLNKKEWDLIKLYGYQYCVDYEIRFLFALLILESEGR